MNDLEIVVSLASLTDDRTDEETAALARVRAMAEETPPTSCPTCGSSDVLAKKIKGTHSIANVCNACWYRWTYRHDGRWEWIPWTAGVLLPAHRLED